MLNPANLSGPQDSPDPDKTHPYVSPELLQRLEGDIPARYPDLDWPERRVWFEAGRRQVVEYLRRVYEAQQENVLER